MKKNIQFIYITFILISLWSCGTKPYPYSLLVADSLVNVKPDSAIVLLTSLKDSMKSQTKATQMYYQLLCIKAKDKAYIHNTSDSLILPVLHYYIEKNDKKILPEAYYYAGRVYRDLGDAPQALEYFRKALESLNKETNYHLKSVIYSQMGTLFSYQGINDEALTAYTRAYECDTELKDSAGMAFDLQDIAWSHRKKKQIDSALYYYKEAYVIASKIRHKTWVVLIQSQIASIYNQLKEYELAKKALEPSLNNHDHHSKSGIYSIASEIYHKTGQIDSAIYYYNKLLTCGTIYAKQAAHHGLSQISIAQNKPQKALLHLQHLIKCTDSIQKLTNIETIQKMNSIYNYKLRENENNQLRTENAQNKLIIIFITAISLILFTLALAYIQYNKRKRLQLRFQLDKLAQFKEEHYRKSVQFITENQKKIEELEEKLKESDNEKSILKESLQKQKEIILYANKQVELEIDKQEEARKSLINSDIYIYFKEQIRSIRTVHISDEDWTQLENAINNAYKGFTNKLYTLHKLNENELRVCLLIKINIQPTDMARLTNLTKETISSIRRRLYHKVFHKTGSTKDWDEFVLSL